MSDNTADDPGRTDDQTAHHLTMNGSPVDPSVLSFEPFWKRPVEVEATPMPAPFTVRTPEGTMTADAGDVLVRGVEDELYPCASDIFYATYLSDESSVPKYSPDDLRAALGELRRNTLEHVPTGVVDSDARAGARALAAILRDGDY